MIRTKRLSAHRHATRARAYGRKATRLDTSDRKGSQSESLDSGDFSSVEVRGQRVASTAAAAPKIANCFQKRLQREVPLGRLVSAEEDALFAAYLCSDAAACFVGQVFPVSGGWASR